MNRRTLSCLLLFATPACDPRASLEWQEHAIINGVEDTSPAHQAVVMVTSTSGNCSGTLISANVVLTAAHCTDDEQPADYLVRFGNRLSGSRAVRVSDFLRHPGYQELPNIKNDIALLRLAASAPENVRCIPHLTMALGLGPDDIGDPLVFVGFGVTDPKVNDYGIKRTVTLPLMGICNSLGGCVISSVSMPPNTIYYDESEAGTCYGDSGGPALFVRGGKEYVAGITSFIRSSDCNGLAFSTKVDAYQQWIDEYVGSDTPNGQGCCADGQCLFGHCVDGVCCDTACDAACQECSTGTCQVAADGAICDDGDPCNGQDSCLAGVCQPGNTPPTCTPTNPCQIGRCQSGIGCVFEPKADGIACDNFNVCDGPDRCQAGQCRPVGPALDCDDRNNCTIDNCDPHDGCLHIPATDGASCADADRCNGAETCQGGVCSSPGPLDCDDQNACTEDSCDAANGCRHQQRPEGYSCAEGRTCQQGLCLPTKGGGGCGTTGESGAVYLLGLLALVWRRRSFRGR